MDINKALLKLHSLLEGWGLDEKDYVLVDEFAYFLQDYNLEGPEIKLKHLDLYVVGEKLPWDIKDERSTIPPNNTPYMRNYEYFMRGTGYSLDLLVANPTIMGSKKVMYKLTDEISFPLMETEAMTQQFVDHTLLHYSLEDVGEHKIKEWFSKLTKLNQLAKDRNDKKLIKLSEELILKVQTHWGKLLA
ncbi:hypothetical protein KKG08_03205 [Patescibacteria group bacterium]|nr:hypothetical protein [Patescibacteria group bacterium]